MDLSIIVPIYNVEEHIRPCINSIFHQNLDENRFEVILVNDGTKDRSMEVIQDIIGKHKNITVINQENQGLSVARNIGIKNSKGKYIFMIDPDDLLIKNSLKPLLEKALKTNVDMIVADFLSMNNHEIEEMHLHIPKQLEPVYEEKTGKQLFLEYLSPYHCYVWRTLYKREFIISQSLFFYSGIRYQDIPFTHECYIKANNCIKTNIILIIYRRWSGSSTNLYDINKAKDYIIALAKTWSLRQIVGLPSNLSYKLEEDVYISFRTLLYHTLHNIEHQSERNKIMDLLNYHFPDLNFTHSIKQRFITILIKKMPYFFINLYYLYAHLFFKNKG